MNYLRIINKLKSILLILLLLLISSVYSQNKCKSPTILTCEENDDTILCSKREKKYSCFNYHGKKLTALRYSKISIKDVIGELNGKPIKKIISKIIELNSFEKFGFALNCDGKVSEKEAKEEMLNFLLDFYKIELKQ